MAYRGAPPPWRWSPPTARVVADHDVAHLECPCPGDVQRQRGAIGPAPGASVDRGRTVRTLIDDGHVAPVDVDGLDCSKRPVVAPLLLRHLESEAHLVEKTRPDLADERLGV